MSVEQQVFDLVELGTGKAAAELTHALSCMGGGSMAEGIKRIHDAGISVGLNRGIRKGISIGIEVGEKAGLYKGVAIGAVGGTAVICVGYIGIKWWIERHSVGAKVAATSVAPGEMQSEESDNPDIGFSHSSAVPEEELMESEDLEELTESQ